MGDWRLGSNGDYAGASVIGDAGGTARHGEPDVSAYLEDAAHFPGGHAAGVVFPRSAEEIAGALRSARSILPIGAQSSLTGGATPMGELLVSTANLTRIHQAAPDTITVGAGVTVSAMQEALARDGAWFPPAPTFTGATAGGIVATNAAGASTFKYGSTRDWVSALTIVLADGTVLDLCRGEARAEGYELRLAGRIVRIPDYRMPAVAKVSAGYFASPDMDAIDLFVGSEGTLGVVADVTFRVVKRPPALALGLVPCGSETQAFELAAALRAASMQTWRSGDRNGVDASAIEHIDRRSIQILGEDGALSKQNVNLPESTVIVLFVQLELPEATTSERAYEQIASFDRSGADGPLVRFCRLLDQHQRLDDSEVAMPGDTHRMEQLAALREAVPAGVNQRVGAAKRSLDDRIAKTAADMIVPFERFAEMNEIYRRGFESRGLDYAIWGHLSDGNVHPNVIPRSYTDVVEGRTAILEFGRDAARLGGCPLAEHGVGRNPVKQELLRQLYGDRGVEQMRAVKQALDPEWKLAPGVIFGR